MNLLTNKTKDTRFDSTPKFRLAKFDDSADNGTDYENWISFCYGNLSKNSCIVCANCKFSLALQGEIIPHVKNFCISRYTEINEKKGEFMQFMKNNHKRSSFNTSNYKLHKSISDPFLTAANAQDLNKKELDIFACIRHSGNYPRYNTMTAKCNCVFIQKVHWVENYVINNCSKLLCPGCNFVVGLGKTSGLRCACGHWRKPAYQILRKYVNVHVYD